MSLNAETVAILGAVLAGLFSLVVAFLNLRSSTRLDKMSRQYDLLKLDLERLERIQDELGFVVMPDLPDADDVKKLPQEEQNAVWQGFFDELNPKYIKSASLMLRHQAIFSSVVQEELEKRVSEASNATGGAMIGLRYLFIPWAVQVVDGRISEIRVRWRS